MNFLPSLDSLIYFLQVNIKCEVDPEQSSCESNSDYNPEEDASGLDSEKYTHGHRDEFDRKSNSSLPVKLKMVIHIYTCGCVSTDVDRTNKASLGMPKGTYYLK